MSGNHTITTDVPMPRPGIWLKDPILLAVKAIVILGIFLLAIPISTLIYTSLKGDDGATLENFSLIFDHPQFRSAMMNTAIVGFGTVIVLICFTVPLAWIYTRTDLPRKNLMLALITINVAIPSFLVAMGYIFILGFIFESAPKYDWSLISTLYQ